MTVLVSDTSVIMDLERAELLKTVFRLSIDFAVPDLLFHRELAGPLGDQLLALGLRVQELLPTEVRRATTLRRADATLSLPGTFAFALAHGRQWTLLTGDAGLKRTAEAHALQVHGTLWILDQLEVELPCNLGALAIGLTKAVAHPRCRLPRADVAARLKRYSC